MSQSKDIDKQKRNMDVVDYNHVWLYSKSHYVQTDTITDLRTILSKRSEINPDIFTPSRILETMANIAFPHMSQIKFVELLRNVPMDLSNQGNENMIVNIIIENLLGVLATKSVLDKDNLVILNIGFPDSDILPLRN